MHFIVSDLVRMVFHAWLLLYGTVRLVRHTEEEKYSTVRYGHLGNTATPYLLPYLFFLKLGTIYLYWLINEILPKCNGMLKTSM